MKTNIISIALTLLILVVGANNVFASATKIFSTCVEKATTAYQDQVDKANKASGDDGYFQLPDKEALDACIDGILPSLNLSIHSLNLDNLLGAICDEINSRIDDQIQAFQSSFEFSPIPGYTFKADSGLIQGGVASESGTPKITVKKHSSDVSRELIDKIPD